MTDETYSAIERSEATTLTRLTIAEGSIDPDQRIRSGDITNQGIENVAEALRGDNCDVVVPTWNTFYVPVLCVDGRSTENCLAVVGFNASGGTFSLVMGDALTHNSFRLHGEQAPQHARRVFDYLLQLNPPQPIGGHSDTNATGRNSGCGAEDKLDAVDPNAPSILRYLQRRGDEIRSLIESLGVQVDDALHGLIVQNVEMLLHESYATYGADIRDAFTDMAGPQSVVTLHGGHNEVLLRINTKEDLTLNRSAVLEKFGPQYQAFNLDIAPLQKASGLLALSPKEAYEKYVGALYYNVATAAVLAGPSLRVLVR